jgi:dTDP-4-amino-4,6-dideoxygalactose transaminase
MPANMDAIQKVAARYGIPIVEDAAEAIGSVYNGFQCGTYGTFGALSFNGNKMITTSGGGALLCRMPEEAERVKFYATQAKENRPYYYHEHIGYNYRLSNVSAGIGRGQLLVLADHIARRRAIHALYVEGLKGVPGIRVQQNPSEKYDSNFWLTCVQLDPNETALTPEGLRLALEQANIESRRFWYPMHLQPIYKGAPFYGAYVAERLFERGLCLPSGSSLTDEAICRVVEEIKKVAKQR